MKTIIIISLYSFYILSTFSSCREKYDSKIHTPDIDDAGMSHGYNLTPLGSLVYSPWNVNKDKDADSANLSNLVFELQKDGSVFYWFKDDYIKSPIDTVTILDGNKSTSHTIRNSKELLKNNWLKNIYKNGSWQANHKDSTLQISFGENPFSLPLIKGSYTHLGSSKMSIKQIKDSSKLSEKYFDFEHY